MMTSIRSLLVPIVLGVFTLGLFGCETGNPRLPEAWQSPKDGPSVLVDTYRIAVSDQLAINVWKNPELSVSSPVRPDGRVSMPLIGDVMAAGRTPEELSQIIENELSRFIKSPNVPIILTGLRGHEFLSRIRVTGSGPLFSGLDVSGMQYSFDVTFDQGALGVASVDVTESGFSPLVTSGLFADAYAEVNISNASINLVPAPGSLALLGLGGLAAARRRR